MSPTTVTRHTPSGLLCPSLPRLAELDGLRGLASAIVVFNHFDSLWPWDSKPVWLQRLLLSPLRVLVGGHEAVILFFMLSGLVLALPYSQPVPPAYRTFLVKRVFRIYVPYLAALALVVTGAAYFHGPVSGMAPWLDRTWSEPINPRLVWQHVAFLGSYNYGQFNPSVWSLIHEMRISIFFPILYLAVASIRPRMAMGLAVALAAIPRFGSIGYSDWLATLHYASIFVLGALLAQNLTRVSTWFSNLDLPGRISLCVSSFLLFTYARDVETSTRAGAWLEDWGVIAGALGLVILSLNSPSLIRFLKYRAIQWLGKISYSTYLIHLPVLLVLVHLLGGSISRGALFALYLVSTGAVALLFHRFVEQPAVLAGRQLAPLTAPIHIGLADRASGSRPRVSTSACLAGVLAAAILICYAPVIRGMVDQWSTDGDMSHGFLVPLSVLWIVWRERSGWRSLKREPDLWGLALLALGAAVYFASAVGAGLFAGSVALLISITGAVLILGGRSYLRAWRFPLLLCLFMLPKLAILYNQLTLPLQLMASRLAASALWAVRTAVILDGNILRLGNQTFSVDEACSGIRFLLSLGFLAVLFAYRFDSRPWMRIALLIGVVPVAVAANALRVFSTVLLGSVNAAPAGGVIHTLCGALIFAACLPVLEILRNLLNRAYARFAT